MIQVSTLSGIPVPGSPRGERSTAPPAPGSLKNLAAEFNKLQDAVDGADAEPSPDARAAYLTLSHTLDSKLQQWELLRGSDVARLDTYAKGQ
jgi:hypothetical protein